MQRQVILIVFFLMSLMLTTLETATAEDISVEVRNCGTELMKSRNKLFDQAQALVDDLKKTDPSYRLCKESYMAGRLAVESAIERVRLDANNGVAMNQSDYGHLFRAANDKTQNFLKVSHRARHLPESMGGGLDPGWVSLAIAGLGPILNVPGPNDRLLLEETKHYPLPKSLDDYVPHEK